MGFQDYNNYWDNSENGYSLPEVSHCVSYTQLIITVSPTRNSSSLCLLHATHHHCVSYTQLIITVSPTRNSSSLCLLHATHHHCVSYTQLIIIASTRITKTVQ
ncbi:hypothetical protein BaRGS_00029063 [Batillaria attramentaria]|uniref:Uncharacterized protein n=1 Tax=Batillaria attramentaria TaxID=370345 RepID=A0ABD0JYA5_9CAEN